MVEESKNQEVRIMQFIEYGVDPNRGATAEELGDGCGLTIGQAMRRVSDLSKKGLIVWRGTRKLSSGRKGRVWFFSKRSIEHDPDLFDIHADY
jgi:hypothetical protein